MALLKVVYRLLVGIAMFLIMAWAAAIMLVRNYARYEPPTYWIITRKDQDGHFRDTIELLDPENCLTHEIPLAMSIRIAQWSPNRTYIALVSQASQSASASLYIADPELSTLRLYASDLNEFTLGHWTENSAYLTFSYRLGREKIHRAVNVNSGEISLRPSELALVQTAFDFGGVYNSTQRTDLIPCAVVSPETINFVSQPPLIKEGIQHAAAPSSDEDAG
jgi:hypothetical protein